MSLQEVHDKAVANRPQCLGGSGGMPPRKILKFEPSECQNYDDYTLQFVMNQGEKLVCTIFLLQTGNANIYCTS